MIFQYYVGLLILEKSTYSDEWKIMLQNTKTIPSNMNKIPGSI